MPYHLEEQLALAAEMTVEGADRESGPLRDRVDRRGVESVLREKFACGVQDALAGGFAVALVLLARAAEAPRRDGRRRWRLQAFLTGSDQYRGEASGSNSVTRVTK